MANYYRPSVSNVLESIMPLLYLPERINLIRDETIFDITGSGPWVLEDFNFDHFYDFYPWTGLHETQEFEARFLIHRDYALYRGYFEAANLFGRNLP